MPLDAGFVGEPPPDAAVGDAPAPVSGAVAVVVGGGSTVGACAHAASAITADNADIFTNTRRFIESRSDTSPSLNVVTHDAPRLATTLLVATLFYQVRAMYLVFTMRRPLSIHRARITAKTRDYCKAIAFIDALFRRM